MKNRIPRKLKKKYKNRNKVKQFWYKCDEPIYSSTTVTIGYIKAPNKNAEYTPYKLIGVENADKAEKTICETKRKLGNGKQ